jgi:purine-binding chemotaxis protein CheW
MSTYSTTATSTESAQQADSTVRQLVVFRLEDSSYGLDIQVVREINRLVTVTPIPKAPSYVEGIINLRGQVVPVVNLGQRFDLARTEHGTDSRIVVVEAGGYTLGLVVDEVSEVLRVPSSDIEAATNMASTGIELGFVEGVGKVDERMILIIGPDRLFSGEEHAALAQIAQG